MEQSSERSSSLPLHHGAVAIEKGAFKLPSTTVINFIYISIYIYIYIYILIYLSVILFFKWIYRSIYLYTNCITFFNNSRICMHAFLSLVYICFREEISTYLTIAISPNTTGLSICFHSGQHGQLHLFKGILVINLSFVNWQSSFAAESSQTPIPSHETQ